MPAQDAVAVIRPAVKIISYSFSGAAMWFEGQVSPSDLSYVVDSKELTLIVPKPRLVFVPDAFI